MISSVVVLANDGFENELKSIKEASIEGFLEGKYIVLIETLDYDENIAVFNKIKALKSVNDINMVFCEAQDYAGAKDANAMADLVNELSKAENIEYYGNIHKKY